MALPQTFGSCELHGSGLWRKPVKDSCVTGSRFLEARWPNFYGCWVFKDHVTFWSYLKPTGHFRSSSSRCVCLQVWVTLKICSGRQASCKNIKVFGFLYWIIYTQTISIASYSNLSELTSYPLIHSHNWGFPHRLPLHQLSWSSEAILY